MGLGDLVTEYGECLLTGLWVTPEQQPHWKASTRHGLGLPQSCMEGDRSIISPSLLTAYIF